MHETTTKRPGRAGKYIRRALLALAAVILAAVLVLRKKLPDLERPYKVWGGAFTVCLTLLINFGMMVNTLINDPVTCVTGLSIPCIAACVYFYFGFRNKKEEQR